MRRSSIPSAHKSSANSVRRALTSAAAIAAAMLVTGCGANPRDATAAPEPELTHVHGVVTDPAGDGFLVATHAGIIPATAEGAIGARIGPGFDAMGLTLAGDTLLASGHPGEDTPAELGTPHLGIIQSTTRAMSWTPVTFTNEKDFHVLAGTPWGVVYGIATDGPDLLISKDNGHTWEPAGATLPAYNLVVDATKRVIASTENGLQTSTDSGATFTNWANTPTIALLNNSPDHEQIVGVDTEGTVWVTTAGATGWDKAGSTSLSVQAVAITNDGDVVTVDQTGVTSLTTARP
ncbi:hypothetical protein ACI2K6_16140 [Microbacterium sp. NPDC006705]|uniref:hypothetical protein n=1 Tax=Microbacterium TaxID=33882 RepID=UPI002B4959F6|nr:hypothetical protein [Microbacterium plantarum]WRK17135.1 hypothetical protein VC184_14695 [Microbacterium plantarum]